MKKLIDVYIYRLNSGIPEFLLLLRAKKKIYANQWRMVGGKVEANEAYWQAALRELKEELDVFPSVFWTIPSVNTFYEASLDQIHQIPAFAAEIPDSASINLDDEHTEYRWVKVTEIDTMIAWPEQKRLIRLTDQLLRNQQILPEWHIEL
ncbi:MAG: NUDIX pyrophosphatase [Balneolaceae bacterium]|nr:NUDIX pyrophosphatase [Balneolaceae bacterium]